MPQYKSAKITTLGQQMMAQDLNNEIDLQFTRMVFGNGTYTEQEYATISARTALKSQKQSISINQSERVNNTSVLLTGILCNRDLEEGYQMSEIGVYAKDSSNQNAEEQLYLIVIADTVATDNGDVLCADWMPAYNGIVPLYIPQQVQIDVVDADETSIVPPEVAIVTMPYLLQHYYDKQQNDELLAGKMNYAVLDTVYTISGLNDIATDSDYADGNYTLIIPIGSGNIMANLDIAVYETAVMTFHGDYPILYFPYNNKTFRYSDSAIYKWVRVYADVNPSDGVVKNMISAELPSVQHAHKNITFANSATLREKIVNARTELGRLYISGIDFIEYVDVESTENAEVLDMINTTGSGGAEVAMLDDPSDTFLIQTWHKANGEITQRFKIGSSGTWTAWAILSPATT